MTRRIVTRTGVIVVALAALIAASEPAGADATSRAHAAALCAEQIVTVLDYEADYNDQDATRVALGMTRKCLSIGAQAEDWRDSGYTTDEVVGKVLRAIARRYRISFGTLATTYDQDYGTGS